MQDEVFPDADDFGRIFRNNAVLSAQGIPQFAAIMGNCVAGGAYLPVLCDTVLMTEGSGLYLAGPALVKAAIGQDVSHEDLGGAAMHAGVSGTVDYREPDDDACLARLRRLVGLLPPDPSPTAEPATIDPPARPADDLFEIVRTDPSAQYDVRDVLAGARRRRPVRRISRRVRPDARLRLRPARRDGRSGSSPTSGSGSSPTGAGRSSSAASSMATAPTRPRGSSSTATRRESRLLFLQDVNGFDVGRDAERSGIIRRGAKLVNAVSNASSPRSRSSSATPSARGITPSAAGRSTPGSSSPGRTPATP